MKRNKNKQANKQTNRTEQKTKQKNKQTNKKTYRIVSNKRSPSNKRPLTYFQIKLGKMPKFLYSVSL